MESESDSVPEEIMQLSGPGLFSSASFIYCYSDRPCTCNFNLPETPAWAASGPASCLSRAPSPFLTFSTVVLWEFIDQFTKMSWYQDGFFELRKAERGEAAADILFDHNLDD